MAFGHGPVPSVFESIGFYADEAPFHTDEMQDLPYPSKEVAAGFRLISLTQIVIFKFKVCHS